MMRRIWELSKSVLIVLLIGSLLLLTVAALPSESIRGNQTLSRMLQPLAPLLGLPQAELAYVEAALPVLDAARPVVISVRNSAGRYTAQWDFNALDNTFETFGSVLGQALDTAGPFVTAELPQVRRALTGSSVYLEYGCTMTAELLASWLDAGLEEEGPSANSCILSLEAGSVKLYLLGETYACADTQVQPEILQRLVEGYRPDGSQFAFEAGAQLQPLALIPSDSPAVSAAAISSALDSRYVEELATDLGFNPYSDTRYTDDSGVTYFTESNCALEISSSGRVLLTSVAEDRFEASGSGDGALVEEARRLVDLVVGSVLGDARIYLSGLTEENGQTVCTFDYMLSGIPVAMSSGSAASVTFSGRSVTRMEVSTAGFTLTGETLYVLPMIQAAAVLPRDGKLSLRYHIGSDGQLGAGWIQ